MFTKYVVMAKDGRFVSTSGGYTKNLANAAMMSRRDARTNRILSEVVRKVRLDLVAGPMLPY